MTGFLGQALLYIVPFLLVLTFIVTIHELGHFLVARAFGVKIDRFSIGFGKSHRQPARTSTGIEWRLGWLPLGGYVKFSGDLDASSVPDQAGLAELRQRVVAEHGAGRRARLFPFQADLAARPDRGGGAGGQFPAGHRAVHLLFSVVGEQIVAPRVPRVAPGTPGRRGRLPAARPDRRRQRPAGRRTAPRSPASSS